MALSRLLVGWVLVAGWLLAWDVVAAWGAPGARGVRGWTAIAAGEALLLTLLGGLWFGSLGAGGWWLLFGLLGTLREWPAAVPAARSWGRAGPSAAARMLRVLRVVIAGGILAWRLAPA